MLVARVASVILMVLTLSGDTRQPDPEEESPDDDSPGDDEKKTEEGEPTNDPLEDIPNAPGPICVECTATEITAEDESTSTEEAPPAEPEDSPADGEQDDNGGQGDDKPDYENPGHHDPDGGENPYIATKEVIPDNHEELFEKSVPDPNKPDTRWAIEGKGKKARIHRFQSSQKDGSGPFHWNGSTDGKTKSGEERSIPKSKVPNEVKKTVKAKF